MLTLCASAQSADPTPIPASATDATPADASDAATAAPNLVPLPKAADRTAVQQAVEESVLPNEPVLALPEASPSAKPDTTAADASLQPLPTDKIISFESKMVEQVKRADALRKAKTVSALKPEIADLKARAFAAGTEREKRVLLRQYYQARQTEMAKGGADLKEDSGTWAFFHLAAVSRPRTEPATKMPGPAVSSKKKSDDGQADDSDADTPQPTPTLLP